VICGDLVNRTAEPAEIAEYKRVVHELDLSIPVYYVAGNHDVGNIPTASTIAGFRASIGPDYYTFSADGMLGVVLDSNLIRAPGRSEGSRATGGVAEANPREFQVRSGSPGRGVPAHPVLR